MSHADFVHLRVHSAYSLSEGAIRISDGKKGGPKGLVSLCNDEKMPAVAVTDTNNIFGALEFSGAASGKGIQPIIGCQLQLAMAGAKPGELSGSHANIVLLCKDDQGYRNLLKLLGIAYMESSDPSEPQVQLEDLEKYGEGLICLTGGPEGPVGKEILEGRMEAATDVLLRLKGAYGDRLYMEIMRHGMADEKKTEAAFLDLAYTHDIPLVATNEAFFATADMFEAHDALLCVAQSTYISVDDRRKLTIEHRFKSAAEMRALFEDIPEAVDNTLVIARRCAFMVESIKPLLPPFDCGEGRTENDELRAMSHDGLTMRLETQVFKEGMSGEEKAAAEKPYRERLDYELGVIIEMGFPGYFLIVADFIQWAKDHGIPVGPGRGSGAGSVVAWALTITDLDPLRFNLLFERFLNPERVSMPDFDIDFCQDRRDEVIRYVQEKYGRDHVAQIITFGKLQAKAVIRDVGRVLEMPYGQVDRISKLIPNNPANPVTLDEAIAAEPQLRQMAREDYTVDRLIGMARKLEGLYRHASTHAAGVVIGDRPLDELIPLYRDPRSDMPVTGYNMKYVESTGLVKFDFLGLKTLTVLAKAVDFIAERGVTIDLSTIPLDDKLTFEMVGRGETTGVFQLESAGMRDVLKQMKADTFEDIIAVVALYRPGPMDNIPSYIKRKHGQEEPDYLYPTLEGILKETFGIMIYQEQVMQTAQELSGYSLGGADLLRRAMGKKIPEEMDKQRKLFVEGAVAKSVPEQKASDIFDTVAKFAGYGFNKSHAAAYALVAYQTAYLKANYPTEFIAASMTLDLGNTDKLNVFRQELDRLNIKLLGPDINKSDVIFRVERDADGNEIGVRYALAALKNVGEHAMETVVAERDANGPFKSIQDFADRLDTKQVNKRQMENLIRAGAFDGLESNRLKLFMGAEALLRHASAAAQERNSNQMSLLGGDAAPTPDVKLPDVRDWPPMERLKEEFDAIGFYLSAHPLDAYGKALDRIKATRSAEVFAHPEAGAVNLAGTVISKKERISQKGNRFAFIQMSDASGVFEITVFSELLTIAGDSFEVGNSLFIRATVQVEGESVRLTANSAEPLDRVASQAAAGLLVEVSSIEGIEALKEVLDREGRGRGEVRVELRKPDQVIDMTLPGKYATSPVLVMEAKNLPGVLDAREI